MRWRVVPESLFGRLLTALLATIGISLVIIVGLLLRERRDLLFSSSDSAAVVAIIASTASSLSTLTGDERAVELARLQRENLRIDGPAPPRRQQPSGQPDPSVASRQLRARLERSLGAGYTVTVRPAPPASAAAAIRIGREPRLGPFPQGGPTERFPGRFGPGGGPRSLDVAVTLPDRDVIHFRTEVPRLPPPLPAALLIQMALVTLVLAVVLYAMARTITRPLAELGAAAEAVGRGGRHVPLRETGARELRDTTRAFNTMQERLHRYLDSRTRVLSAMSHDLRTPLTRLKLRVEVLDDESLRERFNADLDEMNRMITGALNLFRGLNYDEPLAPVSIEALLEELRLEFSELKATVALTGRTTARVNARRDALKRCLTNLMSNAVKYGEGAAVVVEEDAHAVIVRVLDDGPGIPADLLDRVFEPFFRLEGSRNADTGGVGLGLSIARDIAQAHGGSLTLRNRTPHGLEAILRLPKAM